MKYIANEIGLTKVEQVVSDFYDRIQRHPTLAGPFSVVDDWPGHKAHLAHFWWVTLGGRPYSDRPYSVVDKHALAGFTPALLADWLELFRDTLLGHLPVELAEQWHARANNIGRSLVLMHESGHGRGGRQFTNNLRSS